MQSTVRHDQLGTFGFKVILWFAIACLLMFNGMIVATPLRADATKWVPRSAGIERSQIADFDMIVCGQNTAVNPGTRLLFLRSSIGFVKDTKTASPFNDKVPPTVGAPYRGTHNTHVLIQTIPTRATEARFLNKWNGVPPWAASLKWGLGALGLLVGAAVVAPIWKQVKGRDAPHPALCGFIGLTAGVIVGVVIGQGIWRGDFELHIDNAKDTAMTVRIDDYPPIEMEARSHVLVIMEEGIHSVSVQENATGTDIEQFKLSAVLFTSEKKELGGEYVYNIGGANTYEVKAVAYQ